MRQDYKTSLSEGIEVGFNALVEQYPWVRISNGNLNFELSGLDSWKKTSFKASQHKIKVETWDSDDIILNAKFEFDVIGTDLHKMGWRLKIYKQDKREKTIFTIDRALWYLLTTLSDSLEIVLIICKYTPKYQSGHVENSLKLKNIGC